MKKKVRFALGAAGVTPILGMMMPAVPAAAATPASSAKTAGKAVSLRHTGVPAAGCTGHNQTPTVFNSNNTLNMFYFYTINGASGACIGTVKYHIDPGDGSSARIRIYAWSRSHHAHNRVFSKVTGDPNSYGVHRSFSYRPVQVCVAGVSPHGGVDETAACHSVG